MAFSNNSRSFTTIGATPSSDVKSSNTSMNSTFGSTNKVWGSNSVWGNGSLANGFPSRDATRENSRSRDGPQTHQDAAHESHQINGQSGLGSLGTSAISSDWNYKTPWGSKRSLPSSRVLSGAKPSDTALSQQRSVSNVGLPQTYSTASQNASSLSSRPPTINLSNSATQQRPSYASTFMGSYSGRMSENPPNVYTKFERPHDPNARKFPDSAKGGSWADSSPTDERTFQFGPPPGSRGSLTDSVNSSKPPSRHSDDRPFFAKPDYSRPSLRPSQNNSRAPSVSSQGNQTYGGSNFSVNRDELTLQLDQFSIDGNAQSLTGHRPSVPSFSNFAPSTTFSAPSAGPQPSTNGCGIIGDSTEGIFASSQPSLNSFGLGGFGSRQQLVRSFDHANPALGDRFGQSGAMGDVRQNNAFSGAHSSLYDASAGARSSTAWTTVGNTSLPHNRNVPSPMEQSTYVDPHMQQVLSTQLRNAYGSMYNPYAVTNQMTFGGAPPFNPFFPMSLPGLGPGTAAPGALKEEDLTSAILYEFKSNTKSKRYELKDIYDHVAEFSGDQHGSRFIQTKLETANTDEKERVFREIRSNALPLMTDVFGNYVIQKFFEHGDQKHKRTLASMMKGHVLTLSLQMYGCRVVQKALDHVLVDQQQQLVAELENNVLKCVKDQNGNHVIQKAIERCPPDTIGFIINAFRGQVQQLSIHPYGCRVIQRCLERCEPQTKSMIMYELMDGIQTMISDQYGNYVVQHVVEHDSGEAKRRVLDIVGSGLETFSKHKFASNVVEKCLEKSDDMWRRGVVCTLAAGDQQRCEGEPVLVGLIKDNFGNYVIQKLLDTLSMEDYAHFLDFLQPAMTQAKRTGCGKQVLSIEKKMQKFQPFRSAINVGPYNVGMYQLPMPTPPFASYHGSSTATTPPPLTADTQSLQSSGLPSVNGDAVEGATAMGGGSRKGSELSHDSGFLR